MRPQCVKMTRWKGWDEDLAREPNGEAHATDAAMGARTSLWQTPQYLTSSFTSYSPASRVGKRMGSNRQLEVRVARQMADIL